jgi:Mn-dependent DtxR family transcriptional regulator
MNSQESSENYLEAILVLSDGGRPIRAVDIANELDFAKPSVSVAMKKLRSGGYIDTDADGHITLTEAGRKTAESVYEKHTLIADWLIFLGVDRKTAVSDACRMEHVMSEQSFAALKKHIENWKHDVYRHKGGAA